MTISAQILRDLFHKEGKSIVLVDKDQYLKINEEYNMEDFIFIMVVHSGTIDLMVNHKMIHLRSSCCLFLSKGEVKIIDCKNNDCDGFGLFLSKKDWLHLLKETPSVCFMSAIQSCLILQKSESGTLREYYDIIKKQVNLGISDRNPVIINLIQGILYHIDSYYERWSENYWNKDQKDGKIVSEFMALLYNNFKTYRQVSYYARELKISRSKLSEIIKKVTRMSVSECIEQYTIINICLDLQNLHKSIKEMAYEYHFCDVSHFCKFFKKHMGQSPKEYQNGYFDTTSDTGSSLYSD